MNRSFRLLILLFAAAPALAQPVDSIVRIPIDVGLWRTISLSDALVSDTTQRVLNHVALGLPLHQADRLEGLAVGVFGTIYEESVYGVQVAGLANVAGEEAVGIQAAGLANVVGERFGGIQGAGLANVVGEEFFGVQAAGLANVAGENGTGVQGAGFANIAGESFGGVQSSGFANIAGESFRGIQSSGFANISGEGTAGIQAAGFANIAGESMQGIQAAGFANIAGDDLRGLQAAAFNVAGGTMRGVQVGVANVAAEAEGLQVGVVNVAGEQRGVPVGLYSRSGGVPVQLDVWADETAALHVGVRSGSATVSNFAGVSTRPFADAALRWGVFAGLGLAQPLGERTSWGLDALVHGLFADDFGTYGGTLLRLRGTVTHTVGARTAIFGGAALSLFLSDEDDGDSLAPFSFYDDANAGGTGDFVRLWPGLEAGLRVRLTDS